MEPPIASMEPTDTFKVANTTNAMVASRQAHTTIADILYS